MLSPWTPWHRPGVVFSTGQWPCQQLSIFNQLLLLFSQVVHWLLVCPLLHAIPGSGINGFYVSTAQQPRLRWDEIPHFLHRSSTVECARWTGVHYTGTLSLSTYSCHLLWCCCYHGNCGGDTWPLSSFSNAINPQLNADACCEKTFVTGLFWWSYVIRFSLKHSVVFTNIVHTYNFGNLAITVVWYKFLQTWL